MIDKCPICGGKLQATMEQFTVGVVLDDSGDVVAFGQDAGVGESTRVYCENDHTHAEMIAKIKEGATS